MRLLAILCCLFPLALAAQDQGGRTCRLVFLGAGDSDPQTLHLHDGTRSREVDLPRLNLSKIYPLPGGALTVRLLATPPADGEAANPAAPSAKIPETMGDLYLLVSPDPANKVAPVRLQVIDAGSDKFRNGQQLWFNLTAHEVGGQVGKRSLAMKPRSRVVLEAPATRSEEYKVNLNFRIAGKDTLYPLCETNWQHDPDSRIVLFVVNEGGSRAPRVLGFPDRREDSGKKP